VRLDEDAKASAGKESCGNTIGMDVLPRNGIMLLTNVTGGDGSEDRGKNNARTKNNVRRVKIGPE
jgi:hypothetical protein